MQIVIDIPEVFYEYCKAQEDPIEIELAIKNGVPLSKEYKMREATTEELESVNNYIKSISKPTGVNIWDEIEEVTTDADRD